jgi:tetratricopeptide (TPR) repeat protein
VNRPVVIPVLLALALVVAAGSAAAQPREIEALNRICRDALDQGDDLRSASVCKRIHEQVSRLAPGTEAQLLSIRNLAEIKRRQDNNLAADELYTEALRIIDQAGQGETRLAAELLEKQADAKIARGTIFEAEPGLRRAVTIRERVDGATSLVTAETRVQHATVLGLLLQFQDAQIAYRRSLAVFERAGAAQRSRYLATRRQIAELLSRQYRLEQAEAEYQRLLDDAGSAPPVPADQLFALERLAWIALETGRIDDARALYQRQIEMLGASPSDVETARVVRNRLASLASATPLPAAP